MTEEIKRKLFIWARGWEITCFEAGMSKADADAWIIQHFRALIGRSIANGATS